MAEYEITSPQGSTFRITAPDTASESDVLAYAKQNMGASPAPPAPAPPAAPPTYIQQSQKALGIPAFDVAPEKPGPLTQIAGDLAGMAVAPQLFGPRLAATVGAKFAPAVARTALGTAEGAVKGAIDPEGSALAGGGKGALAGMMTEAALGGLESAAGLKKLSGASKAFTESGRGVLKALEFLGDKYKSAPLHLPSLSQVPITALEAAQRIAKTTGPAFGILRDELAAALGAAERAVVHPSKLKNAEEVVKRFTSDFDNKLIQSRTPPGGISSFAHTAEKVIGSTPTRAVGQTVAQENPEAAIVGIPALGYGTLKRIPIVGGMLP